MKLMTDFIFSSLSFGIDHDFSFYENCIIGIFISAVRLPIKQKPSRILLQNLEEANFNSPYSRSGGEVIQCMLPQFEWQLVNYTDHENSLC